MVMLDVTLIWSGALTIFIGLLGYMVQDKFSEVGRVSALLNKTREEIARDNVTQAEIDRITSHIDQRFNKLEEKIDRLITQGLGRT
jgi:archaellum component FlaC